MAMAYTATAPVLERNLCTAVQPESPSAGATIEWSHNVDGDIPSAHYVFTNVETNIQTHVDAPKGKATGLALPAGLYRMVAYARGAAPQRGVVNLSGSNVTAIQTAFTAAPEPPTLRDAAARFGVAIAAARDLEVPAGQTYVLDAQTGPFRDWAHTVRITTLEQAKAMLGHPDSLFPSLPGSIMPRFAQRSMMAAAAPSALARETTREYLLGNSASVEPWKEQIEKVLFDEALEFWLYALGTVTINAGATLVVGHGSHFFLCGRLRIHITGTLKIVGPGPVHVEPMVVEPFLNSIVSHFF